jgi:hypothetical protein
MQFNGKRTAIPATSGFEQSKLEVPRDKLKVAGAKVDIRRRSDRGSPRSSGLLYGSR